MFIFFEPMFTVCLLEKRYYVHRTKVRIENTRTMKKRIGGLAVAIVMIAIVVFLAVDAGFFLYNPNRLKLTSPFGVLDIIRGNILVMKKDAYTWEKAVDGMILETGSRIKTAPDAHAAITFTRGTTTKLEPGTDLVIDKIEDSQGTQPYVVILKQQSGKTWNQVDKTGGNTSFQIRTAAADIMVHGTLFSTEVDEWGKTTVQTTEGRVNVSAGGEEVQVLAGKMTEVKPREKPAAPIAIPLAKNELVITVNNPAFGLVKDPSGSSIGYLNSGAKVNQMPGSSVSVIEESGQTIRIREPEMGDYTLTLRGVTDGTGQVSVEGFVGGKSAFIHIESCNITAARETLLKLHYDVIDGLLQRTPSDQGILGDKVALASQLSDETTAQGKPAKIQPAPAATSQPAPGAISKTEKSPDKGFDWLGVDKYGLIGRLVSIGCLLLIVAVLFVIMRKNS